MSPILRMENVTVRRGNKPILDGISWEVREGEHWVVLGPNGAGKTTVVQLAAGRMYPTRGTVEVLGERLGQVDISELRTRVGLSSSALADRISVTEKVIDVVLTAAYGMLGRWREEYEGEDVQRARALLDAFGVTPLADRRFGTLSEGERKRVQVARSLMSDPELLVLDEPAAGLDLGGREILLRALDELIADRSAPALILVTHHVEEIPAAFTHGLLLREGGVVKGGELPRVMTAENLSRTFDIELEVDAREGRYAARAVRGRGR
ncbi:MAG TPA: ABC transporter ATP-binding protein [Actinomycetaceae bacterium]|nr:ABC transporter ATP-binding protein [Actinomycetaceae bacterium]